MDRETALAKLQELRPRGGADGVRTQGAKASAGRAVDPRPTLGLGLTCDVANGDYKIAVRVQDAKLMQSSRVQAIVDAAGGEVDIEYVGIAQPFATAADPTPVERARPLASGCSISTVTMNSAGTLGCFVTDACGTYALSNSHVLADFGNAQPGLVMLQPGRLDGGTSPDDAAGALARALPVDPNAANLADCALAQVDPSAMTPVIPGLGRPTTPAEATIGESVVKRGRSTEITTGTVTSTHMNLKFSWPSGPIEFTDLIEISAPTGAPAFAAPGDSGALILLTDKLAPTALLVGGSHVGGQIRVYATPMGTILQELDVSMV